MWPLNKCCLSAAALLLTLGCDSRDHITAPQLCITPVISEASAVTDPANVLSAFIRARAPGADSTRVRFGSNAALDSLTPSAAADGDSIRAPIYGLRPMTTYYARLEASNSCGVRESEVMSFTTGSLPEDLRTYTASGSAPLPGFVVFAAGNYGIVIDNTGRIVWYRRFPEGVGLNFQAQPDGRYAARPPAPQGTPASWVEINADGSVNRRLRCAGGLPPRMHDMIAEPDGSYWVLCDETRKVDLPATGLSGANVTGASVQHIAPTGEIIFQWSAFDHLQVDTSLLDSADLVGPAINWTHANAIDLDTDGNVVISFRNLNQVLKIDTRTGAVLWRLGGIGNQFTVANGDASPFVHQHGVRTTSDGRLILLDNLGAGAVSRAEVYQLDARTFTARLVTSFAPSPSVIAQVGGSTQPLPNGHTLVSFGNGGGVEEYDSTGAVVWRLDGNPGYVFRAQRIHSLYHPGAGDPR